MEGIDGSRGGDGGQQRREGDRQEGDNHESR